MTDPITRIMVDFQQMKTFAEAPFIIERAHDVYLYDQQGKQYIDGIAGVFVVSVGHTNTNVMESIIDQLQRLTFSPPLVSANPPAMKLAEHLCALTPPEFNVVKIRQRRIGGDRGWTENGASVPQANWPPREV